MKRNSHAKSGKNNTTYMRNKNSMQNNYTANSSKTKLSNYNDKKKNSPLKLLKNLLIFLLIMTLSILLILIYSNVYIVCSNKENIYTLENFEVSPKAQNHYDYIVIFGAGIFGNDPSPLLRRRLDIGIALYKSGYANKIIMSGDKSYQHDEVEVMKNYAIKSGVEPQNVILDGKGYSTYLTIQGLEQNFSINSQNEKNSFLLVTQKFHLYRALYLAKAFDLEAVGIETIEEDLYVIMNLELREIIARAKDFIFGIIKPNQRASLQG